MKQLIRRNVLLFFRDKSAVFFSFLSVIIILAIYIFFLSNTIGFGVDDRAATKQMGDAWLMSGIIAVTSLTTTMGAFGTMVIDRQYGYFRDFYCAPVRRSTIAGAYIISSIVVGLINTLFTLLVAEVFIVANGGMWLEPAALAKTVGLVVLSVFSGCSFVLLFVSFFRSLKAFSTASSLIGSLVGFLAGLYIPIGVLPSYLQAVLKLVPVSHAAMLLRQVFMQPVIDKYMAAMPEAAEAVKAEMGIVFYVGGKPLPTIASYAFLIGTTVLFFALASLQIARKEK